MRKIETRRRLRRLRRGEKMVVYRGDFELDIANGAATPIYRAVLNQVQQAVLHLEAQGQDRADHRRRRNNPAVAEEDRDGQEIHRHWPDRPARPETEDCCAGRHRRRGGTLMSDPLFIAKFEDGHETCTAVFCKPDALNYKRGEKLARKAYTALYLAAKITKQPPPKIITARFKVDGKVVSS
jgi:hypothetical protein